MGYFQTKQGSIFEAVKKSLNVVEKKKVVDYSKVEYILPEDKEKYQRLLREGRIDLTKQGVYDPGMMRVLKKARCTVERTNFECSLGGE